MIRTLLFNTSTRACHDISSEDALAAWHAPDMLVWTVASAPAPGEIATLSKAFELNNLAVEDALAAGTRPKLGNFNHFMMLTLYAPRVLLDDPEDRWPRIPPIELDEVDLLFAERFVVTICRKPVALIEHLFTQCLHDPSPFDVGMGGLVHHLMDEIVDSYFPLLDDLNDRVEAAQEFAFVGSSGPQAAPHVRALFQLKKQLLTLHRITAPQRDAIMALAREGAPMYEQPTFVDFQDVFDHAVRIEMGVELLRQLMVSSRESFLCRVSNEVGVASKVLLTLTCFLIVPLFFLTLYGMNFEHMPELGWPGGHSLPIALTATGDGLLLLFFRRRGLV